MCTEEKQRVITAQAKAKAKKKNTQQNTEQDGTSKRTDGAVGSSNNNNNGNSDDSWGFVIADNVVDVLWQKHISSVTTETARDHMTLWTVTGTNSKISMMSIV